MFLLDTNIVSELRKQRPHGAVIAWLSTIPAEKLTIPAVVIGEIQDGIEITRSQDPSKADEIEAWLEVILRTHQVTAMDAEIFREWARLMVGKQDNLALDAMIAATARVHGFVVVTRNTKDFSRFNVQLLNPFVYRG